MKLEEAMKLVEDGMAALNDALRAGFLGTLRAEVAARSCHFFAKLFQPDRSRWLVSLE